MSASPEAAAEAQRWTRYAREELALAKVLASDADSPARLVCWHSQQAAEKALKAALISSGIGFPRTHNLVALRAMLPSALAEKMDIIELAELTQWGTESRYPGDWDEPSDEQAGVALEAADGVVAVVEGLRPQTDRVSGD
jgi:HEPN domain-containing protein